jgi:hypothetical protein
MKRTISAYVDALRYVLPMQSTIAFDLDLSEDHDSYWEDQWGTQGDLSPYNLTVTATAILGGKSCAGSGYLSGSWLPYGTLASEVPLTDTGYDYLNSLMQDALVELAEELPVNSVPRIETARLLALLKEHSRLIYDEKLVHQQAT